MARQSTTRQDRADQLLRDGKVALYVGRGFATVAGKTGTYTVTRDGCTCKDAETRDRTGCYHALAVRQLCEEFKALKAASERGERVKPSWALINAVRWQASAATAPARDQSELFGTAA